MGKQKIVAKVQMEDAKKQAKALKAAVGLVGVISATVDGEKLVVVGDGIDSVQLTVLLRKKMGYAELLSVAAAEEKEEKKPVVQVQPVSFPYPYQQYPMAPQHHIYETGDTYNNDPCRVM